MSRNMLYRMILLTLACLVGSSPAAEKPSTTPAPWRPSAYHELFTDAELAKPHVQARSHDLCDFPFIDGQWEGILADSDGLVWFAFSSHSDDHHGQIFLYDPARDKVRHLADLGQVCGEKLADSAPQDKVHSQMFQDGQVIYCGTCEGHVVAGKPYAGGYWLAIDRKTGVVANLGKSITKDGLLCVGYDPWHKLLYGLTNRTGELTVFDPATRKERILGVPWQDVIDRWKASQDPQKPKEIWPRSLTLMITRDGKVYGAKPPACTFWRYDPDTGKIDNLPVDMPLPRDVAAARKALPQMAPLFGAAGPPGAGSPSADRQAQKDLADWQRSAAHLTLWDEQDHCFYFIRSFDQMLMRFFPPEGDQPACVEPVHQMGLTQRRYDQRLASCTLVTIGRTVYYTPYTGWGGVTHLQSYDLATRKFTDHGPIVVEGGRRVCEIHSLAAAKDGKLYAAAFVYSIQGADPVRPYAMRDKYPFHSRLVIIDPATDVKTPTP